MPIGIGTAIAGAAVVGGAATVYASSKASKAAGKASDAQTAANDKALALQQQQADQTRQDYAPWRSAGLQALQQLSAVHGITIPQEAMATVAPANNNGQPDYAAYVQNNPDLASLYASGTGQARGKSIEQFGAEHWNEHGQTESRAYTPSGPAGGAQTAAPATPTPNANPADPYGGFMASPDYQFRKDQGVAAITGNKAAKGLLDSGALGAGLINYGQQAATQEFGSWYDRLASLAGVGQTATNAAASAGAANTNTQTGIIQNQGQNLASSIATQGGISSGLISSLGGTASGLIQNYNPNGVSGPVTSYGVPSVGANIVGAAASPGQVPGLVPYNQSSLYSAVI